MYPFAGAVTLTVFGLCALPLYVTVFAAHVAFIVPLFTVAVNVAVHVA